MPIYLQPHVIAHEIGHVVGLLHEHSRSDRDENVHINWENIVRSNQDYFYKAKNMTTFDIPYDYTSLMHYNMWVSGRERESVQLPRFVLFLNLCTSVFNRRLVIIYTCTEYTVVSVRSPTTFVHLRIINCKSKLCIDFTFCYCSHTTNASTFLNYSH